MLISLNWLKEYLDLKEKKINPKEVALQLSLKGANVEGVEKKGEDYILDVENKSITHRPDLFCHYGIAREVATIFELELKNIEKKDDIIFKDSKENLKITNKNSKVCKRYIAVEVSNIEIKESSSWLKNKMEAIGEKSINNLVDLTNFILFEMGQPMHIFDKEKLSSPEIVIRESQKGEKMVTLDNRELELMKDDYVIADKKKVLALAGVKGGKKAEVDSNTKSIVIEVANFDGPIIRKTSKRQKLRTEASSRYEKRLDPNLCKEAILRFIELLPKVGCDNYKINNSNDNYPEPKKKWEIDVDLKRLDIFAGVKIPKKQIFDIFKRLGLKIISKSEGSEKITLEIPTRRKDLTIEEDIYEEIMRIYGFENITPKTFYGPVTPAKWPKYIIKNDEIKDQLVLLGYDELWLHVFTNKNTLERFKLKSKNHIRVKNALSKEVEFMRTSLFPELLNKTKINSGNFDRFKVFSVDKIFNAKLDNKGKINLKDIKENFQMASCIFDKNANKPKKIEEFILSLKGDVETFLERLNWEYQFSYDFKNEFLEPDLSIGINICGKNIGGFGILANEIKNNFKLKGQAGVFWLDLNLVYELLKISEVKNKMYDQINNFPKIERDLSFWVKKNVSWKEIKETLTSKLKSKILKSIELFDVFSKDENRKEEKSIAVRFSFQAENRTLTDKEADEVMEKVMRIVKVNLKGEIRDK